MTCPHCRSAERVKNGFVRGKQRYKCKDCGCNYTVSSLSRTPVEVRRYCLTLYLEGMGFRGIERVTGVCHTTVMRWVRKLGADIERLRPKSGEVEDVSIMELDELWHFVGKKRINAGSGSPMTEISSKSAGLNSAKETSKPHKDYGSNSISLT